MEVFEGNNLGGIPYALRQCGRKNLNVSLELELWASLDDKGVKELKEAIRANERIATVKFHLRGPWEEIRPLNREAVAALVQAVERLPNLTELAIAGDFVPVPAVTSLLQCARRLRILRLSKFRNLKSCDTKVLRALCQALRRHKKLKSLTLQPHMETTRCEPQEQTLVEFLLDALAEGPALEYLTIESNAPILCGPSLVRVCRMSSLTKLELRPRIDVGVDGLDALANNTHLQELALGSSLSERSTAAIVQIMNTNTTITSLTIICKSTLRGEGLVDMVEPSLVRIAEALRANTTLTYMAIPSGNPLPGIRVLQAFVSVIETNFTLHSLQVFHDMTPIQRMTYEELDSMKDETAKMVLYLGKRVEYYSLLNRSGRGKLLGNECVDRDQWVEKLVEFSYCVDRLFFFLRTNPALCSSSLKTVRKPGYVSV
jgi:hypothetical protein